MLARRLEGSESRAPVSTSSHDGFVARRLAAMYFLVQAIAVTGWWALLAFVPPTWSLFAIHEAPRIALGAFAPGDLGIVAVGSALVALRRPRPWTGPLAWIVAGAMIYGAAYTVTASVLGAAPPLGALLMLPAAVASLLAAAALARDENANAIPTRTDS